MKILIKYATRGRADLFKRSIRNIYDTIGVDNFEILISADNDDLEMITKDIYEFVSSFPNIRLCFGHSESKVHAINRDMQKASQDWDILVNTSDDMFFIEPFWGQKLIEDVTKQWPNSTDWFAHYNDGYVRHHLSTLSIMGRQYYERFGYIYHPEYKSFSCDAEAMYVAQMLEKHHYFGDEKIYFKHLHPANDKRVKKDENYKAASLTTSHDEKVYWKRLNNYFDIQNPKVIPFQEHIGKNLHL